jgi:hypothetical protein
MVGCSSPPLFRQSWKKRLFVYARCSALSSLLAMNSPKSEMSEFHVLCSALSCYSHCRKRTGFARMFCALLPLLLHSILPNQTCKTRMFCALLSFSKTYKTINACVHFYAEKRVQDRQSIIICSACVRNSKMEDLCRLQPWRPNRLSQ